MTPLDALACEPHFVDHLAPVWRALPADVRGAFLVDAPLVERARSRGIEAVPIDARALRSTPQVPGGGDGPPALVASIGDTKVARRLGYGTFAFIEHGAGQSYLGDRRRTPIMASYAGGPDRDDVGLFLVPNEFAAAPWRASYPGATVAVVGSPRVDELPGRDLAAGGIGPVVALSFHFPIPPSNNGLPPEANTAIGEYVGIIPTVAARFETIGHGHPRWDDPQPRRARLWARHGVARFVPEFDDVCRLADVYVCDNSSTIYEFAATGRPVVVLNSSAYRRRINHGLRFWDAADVGVQVDRAADLPAAIDEAIRDDDERRAARATAVELVYPYRGDAAQRASASILRWLGR